jgi:photosystem II stability/assembly factor-like uncharacterized protein
MLKCYLVLLCISTYSFSQASEWDIVAFEDKTVNCLAVNPVDNHKIFVSIKDEGIYITTDGGINWKLSYQTQNQVNCLAIDRFNIQHIYGGYQDGVLLSTSEGNRFQEIVIEKNISVSSIVIDETPSKCILVGTAKGIYKSFDGGKTFLQGGLNNFTITCLAINNSGPKAVLYAGTSNAGVFKSANYGTSWSPCNKGLANLNIYSLLCNIKNPSVIFLGTLEENIYTSENNGDDWKSVLINNKLNQGYVFAQAIDNASNASVVFLTSLSGDVYNITDYGASIKKLSGTVQNIYGTCLGVSNIIPSTLYLGTTKGLYKFDESKD